MKTYEVKLTTDAQEDREQLARYISEEVHAPATAKSYLLGLQEVAQSMIF